MGVGWRGLGGSGVGLHRVEAKQLYQTRAFHTLFPRDGLEQWGSLSHMFSGVWGVLSRCSALAPSCTQVKREEDL